MMASEKSQTILPEEEYLEVIISIICLHCVPITYTIRYILGVWVNCLYIWYNQNYLGAYFLVVMLKPKQFYNKILLLTGTFYPPKCAKS